MAITLLNNGLDIEALPLSVRLRKSHEFPMATHDAQVSLSNLGFQQSAGNHCSAAMNTVDVTGQHLSFHQAPCCHWPFMPAASEPVIPSQQLSNAASGGCCSWLEELRSALIVQQGTVSRHSIWVQPCPLVAIFTICTRCTTLPLPNHQLTTPMPSRIVH